MPQLVTDWIRSAVAGKTADGRDIQEQQLEEIANSYDPSTYNARIWPEHIRGVMPDGMFKALGDVMEVKAERISGGALAGKLALYVKIAPHPDLVAMVRNGQKVHLSVEINPDFAGTKKAYLMGLGVTDSPASLGTGIMKFSVETRQDSLFSTPALCDLSTCQPAPEPQQFAQKSELAQLRTDLTTLRQQFTQLSAQVTAWGNEEFKVDDPAGEVTGYNPNFENRQNRERIGY